MESEKRTAPPACFSGTIGDFLHIPYEQWIEEMCRNYDQLCGERPSVEQIGAWGDCYRKMKPVFESLDDDEGYLALSMNCHAKVVAGPISLFCRGRTCS